MGWFEMILRFAVVSAVVLLCVLIQAGACALCIRVYARFLPLHGRPTGVISVVSLIFLMVMCLLIGHLMQIACWGAFFVMIGAFGDLYTAVYFSGATYTTIGYGDVVLPVERYMLGPLVGITGLLMAGVSTAVMAAVVTNVINRRLAHFHERRQAEKKIIST
jgi:hypothetical protein